MSAPGVDSRAADGREPKRVVVTRSEADDGPLSSELRNLGLPVLLWPAVSVTLADPGPLQAALARLASFQWVVFASRHAVAAVTGLEATQPAALKVAAVGQATAHVLRQRGWSVDLLPDDSNAAALVDAFAAAKVIGPGSKVFFPASSRALPTIATGLRQLGAEVTQVEAYRTQAASVLDVAGCRAWIARDGVAAVTFASPSAVDELEHALGKADFDRLLSSAPAVAIGPTTAKALTERGHTPALAEVATLQGLAHTTHRILQSRDAAASAAPF